MDFSVNQNWDMDTVLEGLERDSGPFTAKLSSILDNPGAAIFVKDLSGRYVLINTCFYQLFAITRDDIIGKTDFEFFPETEATAFRQKDREVLETGEARQLEEQVTAPDGRVKTFVTVKFPIFDAEGRVRGICGIATEISDLVRARQELQQAKDEAEAAIREKFEFLAQVSHELRTPLASIIGFSELLAVTGESEKEHQEYLQAILRNSNHLLELVNNTLEASKREASKLEYQRVRFSPVDEARTALAMLSSKAQEKGIRLSLDSPAHGGIPTLVSDPLRFRQILLNLVSNALKFTERGGFVVVKFNLKTSNVSDQLAIDVIDTGRGIAEDEKDRLFRPFSQANSEIAARYGGSGMGLAISRRIAQGLGARLYLAKSHPGFGSTFSLEFDLPAESPASQAV